MVAGPITSFVVSLEVVRRVARGGMGVIDLAQDAAGARYALKRVALYGTAGQMAVARSRIRREAEALQRIDDAAVVPLLDVIDDGDDVILVMPYLEGGNLAERVRASGPLGPDETLELGARILGALAAAHRAGIVHRDVTPANVLFDDGGCAYLADFGIADDRNFTPGLTNTGEILGTPSFLAPERAAGLPATPAGDVFAAGATLLYAATGQGPYGTGRPEVMVAKAARARRLRAPRSLAPAVRQLIDALLAVRPDDRPSAAAASAGVSGTGVLSRPKRPGARRLTWAAAVGAVLGTALGAGAVAGTDASGRPIDEAAVSTAGTPVEKQTSCPDLPYQPCGAAPAANTDGKRCVGSFDDYDGLAGNGCEAKPDSIDGQQLRDVLRANLVPRDDVDRYPTFVGDGIDIFCSGRVVFTLTAPAGAAHAMRVIDPGRAPREAVSANGQPVEIAIDEACGTDDARWLDVEVRSVGEPVSDNYTLEVSGSF